MINYIDNEEKIKSPIKYYRKILKITQKELAGEKYTRGYIQTLESGKRVPPYKCAVYLVEKITEIAKEKKIKVDITVDELLKTEKERVYSCFKDTIEKINLSKTLECDLFDYETLIDTIKRYDFNDLEKKVKIIIAENYYNKKEYLKAIQLYNEYLKDFEYDQYLIKEVNILKKIGTCFLKINKYEKAIESYEKAKKMYNFNNMNDTEEYIKILFNISLVFNKIKDFKKSIIYIKEAISLGSASERLNLKLNMQLGANYIDNKEYDKALKIYNNLYKDNPDNYLINYNIATIYEKLGDKDKVEVFLNKCLSIKFEDNQQKSIYSLILLAKLKLEKKEISYAKKCFKYAIEISSKFKDGEMFMYSLNNIYELLQENKIGENFSEYLDEIINNEEIVLNNNTEILLLLLKFSVNSKHSEEDREKINKIIEIVERGS
ncbi:helix-turn-helix domain-containing protein [Oceanirhabdus sp. W0125-5]|uniref:helix-turn-helix domain-containing protein n=1 Tax=Oceanirhabdus sp. W0125-5 TaxID=2999116 RepID=UPI0022F31F71|nr:tetratricopeptide repeat protein [Oceanirhabdus sp. W0125-5]WBW96383.1 tetratricopeptide repeat protein [Oceanirhabdus sp. W0125-5]